MDRMLEARNERVKEKLSTVKGVMDGWINYRYIDTTLSDLNRGSDIRLKTN